MVKQKQFRVDETLFSYSNDDEVEVMIDSSYETSHGEAENLIGRTKVDGKYRYARAHWNPKTGQMSAGKWTARGRTAGAFRNVAEWVRRLSDLL